MWQSKDPGSFHLEILPPPYPSFFSASSQHESPCLKLTDFTAAHILLDRTHRMAITYVQRELGM